MSSRVLSLVLVFLCVCSACAQSYNMTRVSPHWSQCDSRWGANKLGSSSTICAVGCLMTSVASGLRSLGVTVDGKESDPAVLNQYLLENGGYAVNSLIWGKVEPLGVRYIGKTSVQSEIREAIRKEKIVTLQVNGGAHWVLATGFSGQIYYVRDSGYVREHYGAGEVVLASIYEPLPKSAAATY